METEGTTNSQRRVTWEDFIQEHPTFQSAYGEGFGYFAALCSQSPADENSPADRVILGLLVGALSDFNDIMILCCSDRPLGAMKLLRGLYERVTTAKYLTLHPEAAEAFEEFDAIDSKQVFDEVEKAYGFSLSDNAARRLNEAYENAKAKFTFGKCPSCKERKRKFWTNVPMPDMAKAVVLDHMYLDCYLVPTKLLHTTLFGSNYHNVIQNHGLYNAIKSTHFLLMEAVLTFHKHFIKTEALPPETASICKDWRRVWSG